jgi:hypothetical protein
MAVTINADNGAVSGSAGLKSSSDGTGVLALQTNGTTAVSISTAQVVTLTNALPATSGGTGLTSPGANNNVLTSNGSAWVSSAPAGGGFSNMVVLTSTNASYSIPATKIQVTVIGGGGGSGSASGGDNQGASGGGGGGGTAIKILSGLTIGNTLNITVGAGGTAGAVGGNPGVAGGTSSVASGSQSISTVSATGGALSIAAGDNSGSNGGNGGTGSGGDINMRGSPGGAGIANGLSGFGGSSFFGGGGPNRIANSAGVAGGQYGGGGGGAASNGSPGLAGSAGGAGVVIVEY